MRDREKERENRLEREAQREAAALAAANTPGAAPLSVKLAKKTGSSQVAFQQLPPAHFQASVQPRIARSLHLGISSHYCPCNALTGTCTRRLRGPRRHKEPAAFVS